MKTNEFAKSGRKETRIASRDLGSFLSLTATSLVQSAVRGILSHVPSLLQRHFPVLDLEGPRRRRAENGGAASLAGGVSR